MRKRLRDNARVQRWFAVLSMLGLSLFIFLFLQGRFQQAELEYHREARRTLLFAQKSISDSIQAAQTEEELEQAMDILRKFEIQLRNGKGVISVTAKELFGMGRISFDSIPQDTSIVLDFRAMGEDSTNISTDFVHRDSSIEIKQRVVQKEGAPSNMKAEAPIRDPLVIVDTNLVEIELSKSLFQRYPTMSLHWQLLDTNKNRPFNPHAYVLMGSEDQEILPVFEGISLAAFNKIKTDMLFSLLLVFLVGFAFYQLIKGSARQEKLLAFKNQLISNISHELKTPVSSVKIAIESLLKRHASSEDERTQTYLDQSAKEIERLQYLVDKVLQSALLEENALHIQRERCDLNACVLEASKALQLLAQERKVKVDTQLPEKATWVNIDKDLTCRAIANILENALKYGPEDASIDVKVKLSGNRVILSVRDYGPGVNPKYLKSIFDRFFRMPTGNVHNVKGHGLGLHFVKSIFQRQGVDVSAQNMNPGLAIIVKFHSHA